MVLYNRRASQAGVFSRSNDDEEFELPKSRTTPSTVRRRSDREDEADRAGEGLPAQLQEQLNRLAILKDVFNVFKCLPGAEEARVHALRLKRQKKQAEIEVQELQVSRRFLTDVQEFLEHHGDAQEFEPGQVLVVDAAQRGEGLDCVWLVLTAR